MTRRMRDLYTSDALSVALYDALEGASLDSPIHGDREFFLKVARKTGGPVLELGVGTGRVALHLAEKGFMVTGLDASPHMLKVARGKLTPALKSRVRLVRGDMARFDLRRKFRLIIIPFRAFQYLKTPAKQRACLGCVRRHLARGGRFIVDIFDPRLDYCLPPPRKTPTWRKRVRHPATGDRVEARNKDRRPDPFTQTFAETTEYTVQDRRGRVKRRSCERLALRWTYRYEMLYLLELAGFKVLACYGDFKGGPPRYGAEQVWVATRTERSRGK
ncbi:MAG: class I SAM-dependent methyltransferase [Elusimicrobiota bacterium]